MNEKSPTFRHFPPTPRSLNEIKIGNDESHWTRKYPRTLREAGISPEPRSSKRPVNKNLIWFFLILFGFLFLCFLAWLTSPRSNSPIDFVRKNSFANDFNCPQKIYGFSNNVVIYIRLDDHGNVQESECQRLPDRKSKPTRG